jgi:uncharacterized protein (TIGR03437 family)
VDASPEVFQQGAGTAAAVNQDGSINSASHPAAPGSVVAIWATGIGAIPFGGWQDGVVATGAVDFGCCQVSVQGRPANVLYGGAAPGIVAGVAQVNFQVPAQVVEFGPTVDVTLGSGGGTSATARIYVLQTGTDASLRYNLHR